jgi:hypothetical protein
MMLCHRDIQPINGRKTVSLATYLRPVGNFLALPIFFKINPKSTKY